MSMDIRGIRAFCVICAAVVAAALSGLWPPPARAQTITLSGTFVAGPVPVAESAVAAYAITNNQVSTTTPIAVGVTNASGNFTLNLPANQSVYIVGNLVPNGYYNDPVLGPRQLSGQIRAVLYTPPVSAPFTLSPMSEAATQVALGENSTATPGPVTPAVIAQANALAATYLIGVQPLTTTPLNATSAAQMATATNAQKLFALELAGFSQAQSDANLTLSAATAKLASAIGGGTVLTDAGGGFSADPENEVLFNVEKTLQQGVAKFTASRLNASGVTSLYNLSMAILGGPSGGTTANVPWTQACTDSVLADISTRLAPALQTPLDTQYWQTPARFAFNTFGPSPGIYAPVTIPADCNRTAWMQNRVLAVANAVVQQQNNYCHHYIPAWNSAGMTFAGQASYCFAGPVGANVTTKTGVDCSNFSAFVYNLAFGQMRFTGGVTEQGGSPDASNIAANVWSPGTPTARPANWKDIVAAQSYSFQPGDLLYIAGTEANAINGGPITHVVMWTGLKAADGSGRYITVESFGTVNQGQTELAQAPYTNAFPFQNTTNTANPVTMYVNNAGPNLRFFDGTFRASNFVMSRRIIPM